MHRQRDLHLGLQVGGLIADEVGLEGDLVVVLGVHEMKAVAVLVQKLMLAVLDIGAFDLLGGLVALGDLYPVADPAHVHLGGRGSFAGMEAFGVEDDVEFVVDFDDIAFAKRAGDDFHGWSSSLRVGAEAGSEGKAPRSTALSARN